MVDRGNAPAMRPLVRAWPLTLQIPILPNAIPASVAWADAMAGPRPASG